MSKQQQVLIAIVLALFVVMCLCPPTVLQYGHGLVRYRWLWEGDGPIDLSRMALQTIGVASLFIPLIYLSRAAVITRTRRWINLAIVSMLALAVLLAVYAAYDSGRWQRIYWARYETSAAEARRVEAIPVTAQGVPILPAVQTPDSRARKVRLMTMEEFASEGELLRLLVTNRNEFPVRRFVLAVTYPGGSPGIPSEFWIPLEPGQQCTVTLPYDKFVPGMTIAVTAAWRSENWARVAWGAVAGIIAAGLIALYVGWPRLWRNRGRRPPSVEQSASHSAK